MKLLFERRSYACLLAGLGFAGFAVSAFAAWLPTYYDRTFGLGMAEIGVAFGLAYGLGSTAGILVGGVVATPLVARDVRWALLIPVFGYVLAAPLLLFALFTASFPFAMGLLFAGFAILTSGFGAVYALVQTVAPAPLRSLAVALAILASNLIGAGIGPLIVGAVSDVAGAYGAGNPLQIGLLAALLFYPFPPLFYLAGTRYVAADAA